MWDGCLLFANRRLGKRFWVPLLLAFSGQHRKLYDYKLSRLFQVRNRRVDLWDKCIQAPECVGGISSTKFLLFKLRLIATSHTLCGGGKNPSVHTVHAPHSYALCTAHASLFYTKEVNQNLGVSTRGRDKISQMMYNTSTYYKWRVIGGLQSDNRKVDITYTIVSLTPMIVHYKRNVDHHSHLMRTPPKIVNNQQKKEYRSMSSTAIDSKI